MSNCAATTRSAARPGFEPKGDAWPFVAGHDVAGRTPADAYLELAPAMGHSVRSGQFKQPFPLEDAVSDKQAPFLDQSPPDAFGISRRIGIECVRRVTWDTLNAALFGQCLDGSQENPGVSTRATWKLHERDGRLLHIGGGFASESPDGTLASFTVHPGTPPTDRRLVRTGKLPGVDRIDRAAVEALWIDGAWSRQGEHARVAAQRDAAAGAHGHAQSLLATWSPGGHARGYEHGSPGAPSGEGRIWELSVRWSMIDLDSGAVARGDLQQVGLAASCSLNNHVKTAANLVHSERDGAIGEPLLAAMRVQLTC